MRFAVAFLLKLEQDFVYAYGVHHVPSFLNPTPSIAIFSFCIFVQSSASMLSVPSSALGVNKTLCECLFDSRL